MKKLVLFFLLLSSNLYAQYDFCQNSIRNQQDLLTMETLAQRMDYSFQGLCTLPRLAGIYITDEVLFNSEIGQFEDHTWVTLHYYEYSCQYFFKNEDLSLTKSNCYNTF